jgi:hypothetical protein
MIAQKTNAAFMPLTTASELTRRVQHTTDLLMQYGVAKNPTDDTDTKLRDLLIDLQHTASAQGIDFDTCLNQARGRFCVEVWEATGLLPPCSPTRIE